jgi:hypothetical protein
MPVCVYSVFVLSCVQVATLQRADPPSKEFYRLCKKIKRLKKSGQGPTKGCRAIYIYIYIYIYIDRQKDRQTDRQIDRHTEIVIKHKACDGVRWIQSGSI